MDKYKTVFVGIEYTIIATAWSQTIVADAEKEKITWSIVVGGKETPIKEKGISLKYKFKAEQQGQRIIFKAFYMGLKDPVLVLVYVSKSSISPSWQDSKENLIEEASFDQKVQFNLLYQKSDWNKTAFITINLEDEAGKAIKEIFSSKIGVRITNNTAGIIIDTKKEWKDLGSKLYLVAKVKDSSLLDQNAYFFKDNDVYKERLFLNKDSGYYYTKEGVFLGKAGIGEDVYACDGKENNKYSNPKLLLDNNTPITHSLFVEIAGWVYNENTSNSDAQKASMGMLKNWLTAKNEYDGFKNIHNYRDAMNLVYATITNGQNNSVFKHQKAFITSTMKDRNNTKSMKSSIAAVIYVLREDPDYKDYSNGAVQEHGRDFFIQYQDKAKTREWPMYKTQQAKGYTWSKNGYFNGDYTPETKPQHLGFVSKEYTYVITATYSGNIYAKFSDKYKKTK